MKKIVLSLIAGWILFIATAYASPYDGYDITNKVEQYGDDRIAKAQQASKAELYVWGHKLSSCWTHYIWSNLS